MQHICSTNNDDAIESQSNISTRKEEKLNHDSLNELTKSHISSDNSHYLDEKKPPKIARNSKFRYSNYMIDGKSNTSPFKSSSNANNYSSSTTNLNFTKNSIVSSCIMKFENKLSIPSNPNDHLVGSNANYEALNNLDPMLNNNAPISIKKVKII